MCQACTFRNVSRRTGGQLTAAGRRGESRHSPEVIRQAEGQVPTADPLVTAESPKLVTCSHDFVNSPGKVGRMSSRYRSFCHTDVSCLRNIWDDWYPVPKWLYSAQNYPKMTIFCPILPWNDLPNSARKWLYFASELLYFASKRLYFALVRPHLRDVKIQSLVTILHSEYKEKCIKVEFHEADCTN